MARPIWKPKAAATNSKFPPRASFQLIATFSAARLIHFARASLSAVRSPATVFSSCNLLSTASRALASRVSQLRATTQHPKTSVHSRSLISTSTRLTAPNLSLLSSRRKYALPDSTRSIPSQRRRIRSSEVHSSPSPNRQSSKMLRFSLPH